MNLGEQESRSAPHMGITIELAQDVEAADELSPTPWGQPRKASRKHGCKDLEGEAGEGKAVGTAWIVSNARKLVRDHGDV